MARAGTLFLVRPGALASRCEGLQTLQLSSLFAFTLPKPKESVLGSAEG